MFDVEFPVAIKIPGKLDGSELDEGFSHLLGPAHAGAFHAIFDEVLAGAFDRAAGNRPAVGKGFVVPVWSKNPIHMKI